MTRPVRLAVALVALGLPAAFGCAAGQAPTGQPPPPLLRSGGVTAGGARAGVTATRPAPAQAAHPGAAAARRVARAPCPDADHDDLCDAADRCPAEAEDHDGFEDEDGCPDLDNDRDGIPDDEDRCPDQPRLPGHQEGPSWLPGEHGCPDRFISEPMGTVRRPWTE